MKLIGWLTNELCEMINDEYIRKNQITHLENTAISMVSSAMGQLTGTAATAIQNINHWLSTNIPHENRDLKKTKTYISEQRMKTVLREGYLRNSK